MTGSSAKVLLALAGTVITIAALSGCNSNASQTAAAPVVSQAPDPAMQKQNIGREKDAEARALAAAAAQKQQQ